MKSILAASALAIVLTATVASDASAWTRNSTTTGAYGNTVNQSASGSCYGGTCSRSATTVGPYGRTATHNGAVSCSGGSCSHSGVTTGTYGGAVTHQGTVTVQP
jgi:hypothetical protein